MPAGQPQPGNAGNGKNRPTSAVAVWIAKHLGIPTGLTLALVTWGSSWLENKQKEYKDTQKAIIELREEVQGISKDIQFLQEQKGTDQAQWRALQRVGDKIERTEITARTNEILLDKILDDSIRVRGEPSKVADGTIRERLSNLLSGKKKPSIIVRRAPPKAAKSVEEYKQDMENQYEQEQEQMQMQRPMPRGGK